MYRNSLSKAHKTLRHKMAVELKQQQSEELEQVQEQFQLKVGFTNGRLLLALSIGNGHQVAGATTLCCACASDGHYSFCCMTVPG